LCIQAELAKEEEALGDGDGGAAAGRILRDEVMMLYYYT
jgi:hypothetical protein